MRLTAGPPVLLIYRILHGRGQFRLSAKVPEIPFCSVPQKADEPPVARTRAARQEFHQRCLQKERNRRRRWIGARPSANRPQSRCLGHVPDKGMLCDHSLAYDPGVTL